MNKRIFSYDFVRAIATVLIVITHFNARYIMLGTPIAYSKMIIGANVFNIYIGGLGVSLFLIISGASLMATYEKNLDWRLFWKKRFLSIYPMFWIAYLFAFLHQFMRLHTINQSIPKRNIFFSILGIDGYLANAGVPTFYILGEWFLGFILIIYIIFPLLRFGVLNYPVKTGIIISLLYIATMVFYNSNFPENMFIFTRLPEVFFGMYFHKYLKKVNFKVAFLAVAVLVINTVYSPTFSQNIQTTYIGIASFLLLSYIGSKLEANNLIVRICKVMCKYSYAIFLVHHYIIARLMENFDLNNITVLESYILFLLIIIVIAIFARLLYMVNGYCIDAIGNGKSK